MALGDARLNIALGRPQIAARGLEDVLAAQPASLVVTVSATVLLAQSLRQLGDLAGAAEQIEHALRLAAPEGVRAPFLGHGSWIAELLDAPAAPPPPPLEPPPPPLEQPPASPEASQRPPAAPDVFEVAAAQMAEPLTEREMLVLQYLRSMLSIAEIATVLSVSANTVKTHVRHVYRKLGVSRRRDAVRKGRELSLI